MPTGTETLLLDTHIWIRVLAADPVLAKPGFLSTLEQAGKDGRLRLAAISLWETAMLASKSRLKLSLPVRDWVESALKMPGLKLVPLDSEIACDSCFLPGDFHGDPADRLIASSARCTRSTLVTLDEALLKYAQGGYLNALSPFSFS